MKETGVIRRIDELGRVVIPKEIRKRFQIDNGDLVDIFIENEHIILKKFHPLSELSQSISVFLEALTVNTNTKIVVCDKDTVVASNKNIINPGSPLSSDFKRRVKDLLETDNSKALMLKLTDSFLIESSFYCKEIRFNSELFGYVIVMDQILSTKVREQANICLKYLSFFIA